MSQHFQEFVVDFFPHKTVTTSSFPNVAQYSRVAPPWGIEHRPHIGIYATHPAPGSRTIYDIEEMKARACDREVAKQKDTTLRENPRLFQRETTPYVDAIINGCKMPLFVDSGVLASVMSLKTCKKLSLMTSVDVSQAGVATGVEFTRIYGKLWRVPVEIGRTKFHMQFNIIDMGASLILGIYQMKRLGMRLDFKKRGLKIGYCFVPFTKPPPEDDDTLLANCDINACDVL